MIKVIKFLILGVIILHLSDASASVNTKVTFILLLSSLAATPLKSGLLSISKPMRIRIGMFV